MQRIGEVGAVQVLQSRPRDSRSSQQSSATAQVDSAQVQHVFDRMQSHYGPMWSARITSPEIFQVMVVDWGMAMRTFDTVTIDRAFKRCVAGHPKCPTLPEFVEQCKASRPPKIFRALPAPKANLATVEAGLTKMRQALGLTP